MQKVWVYIHIFPEIIFLMTSSSEIMDTFETVETAFTLDN